MAPRLIADCTFDELEGALQIRYGSRLRSVEKGQTYRKYRIGRIYKLRADLHRGAHLQVALKFRAWFVALLVVIVLWGLLALVAPGVLAILVIVFVFAWWLPRKTKRLAAELEEAVRLKQEQDRRVVREEPSVIVKPAEPVVESEVVMRKAEPDAGRTGAGASPADPGAGLAMKHCIKCGQMVRADAKACGHCGADLA